MVAPLLYVCNLGRMDYERTFDLQLELVGRLMRDEAAAHGYLLLVEHSPTFTIGRSGSEDNVFASADELAARGARLLHVNRGGDVTFHGPGQVVAYPIVRLVRQSRDVHRYLRQLEEAIIRTVAHFGIVGSRFKGYTGVWVGEEKVAAIGVAIRRWITYHGVAINASTDMSYFDMIRPCGIRDFGVTSLARLLGRDVEWDDVAKTFAAEFAQVFGMAAVDTSLEKLLHDD